MGFFKDRSDYFKSIANKNKAIAHDRFIAGNAGPKRKSFFRLNDEEELIAACANWAHFPCLVHFGYSGKYSENPDSDEMKRNMLNDILILEKASSATDMGSIETAKDTAFEVMEQIISQMKDDADNNAYCSPFAKLDMDRFSFSEYGPVNSTLYGFRLSFNDDTFPDNITEFDATKWFDD